MAEIWKPIPGFEGRFEASNLGRVRSLGRMVKQINRWGEPMLRLEPACVFKQSYDKDGYRRVSINELPTGCVHRLVAMAFVPNPKTNRKSITKTGARKTTSLKTWSG